jgi:hypothetical protein
MLTKPRGRKFSPVTLSKPAYASRYSGKHSKSARLIFGQLRDDY